MGLREVGTRVDLLKGLKDIAGLCPPKPSSPRPSSPSLPPVRRKKREKDKKKTRF